MKIINESCFSLFDNLCHYNPEATAAWVQAIGGIAGIAITTLLYGYQIYSQKRQKTEDKKEHRNAQLIVGKMFSEHLEKLIIECVETPRDGSLPNKLSEIEPRIGDIIIWSRVFILD